MTHPCLGAAHKLMTWPWISPAAFIWEILRAKSTCTVSMIQLTKTNKKRLENLTINQSHQKSFEASANFQAFYTSLESKQ